MKLIISLLLLSFAPTAFAEKVTQSALVEMYNSGLDASVILSKIQRDGLDFEPTTAVLIELGKAGLPKELLSGLLTKSGGDDTSYALALGYYKAADYAKAEETLRPSLILKPRSDARSKSLFILSLVKQCKFDEAKKEIDDFRLWTDPKAQGYVTKLSDIIGQFERAEEFKKSFAERLREFDSPGAQNLLESSTLTSTQKLTIGVALDIYKGEFTAARGQLTKLEALPDGSAIAAKLRNEIDSSEKTFAESSCIVSWLIYEPICAEPQQLKGTLSERLGVPVPFLQRRGMGGSSPDWRRVSGVSTTRLHKCAKCAVIPESDLPIAIYPMMEDWLAPPKADLHLQLWKEHVNRLLTTSPLSQRGRETYFLHALTFGEQDDVNKLGASLLKSFRSIEIPSYCLPKLTKSDGEATIHQVVSQSPAQFKAIPVQPKVSYLEALNSERGVHAKPAAATCKDFLFPTGNLAESLGGEAAGINVVQKWDRFVRITLGKPDLAAAIADYHLKTGSGSSRLLAAMAGVLGSISPSQAANMQTIQQIAVLSDIQARQGQAAAVQKERSWEQILAQKVFVIDDNLLFADLEKLLGAIEVMK